MLEACGFVADAATRRRLQAMACASLLREMMWTMVSEAHRRVDVDFAAYMADVEPRFEAAWRVFGDMT